MPKLSIVWILLVGFAIPPLVAQTGSSNLQITSSTSVSSGIGAAAGGFPIDESQRNQPYTLTQQTTTVRTLADGTHITTIRQETRIRDAEGRVRTEITRDGKNPMPLQFVQIFDPVAHTLITLNEQGKQAHINHLPEPKLPSAEQQARMAELRSKAEATRATQADQPTAAQTTRNSHREVETLSPRTIAGVSAEGRRITRIIPAGKEGNDRDLTIVTETWTSPELHVVLERTTDDPRSGKVTMTTSSLERASPDPALFQIPADYKVVDQQPASLQ